MLLFIFLLFTSFNVLLPDKAESILVVSPTSLDNFFYSHKPTEISLEIMSKQDIYISLLIKPNNIKEYQAANTSILSEGRSWLYSKKKKKIIFTEVNGQPKKYFIKKNQKQKISILMISQLQKDFKGELEFYSNGKRISSIPIHIQQESLIWKIIYGKYPYLVWIFIIIMLILFIFIKNLKGRKKLKVNSNTDTASISNEYIFFIDTNKKYYISAKKNPFNCYLPFVEIPFYIKFKKDIILIRYKKINMASISININTYQGYYKKNINEQYEIEIIQENFETAESVKESLLFFKISTHLDKKVENIDYVDA